MDRIAEIAEAVVDLFDKMDVNPSEARQAMARVAIASIAIEMQERMKQRIKESQN